MNKVFRHTLLFSALMYAQKGMPQEYVGRLPDFDADQASIDLRSWQLKLNVNGHVSNQFYQFQRRGEDFWGDAQVLRANNIHVDDNLTGLVNIAKLPNVKVSYNNATSSLELTVPAAWLPTQYFDNKLDPLLTAHRDTGLLINYDLYAYRPSRQNGYGSANVSTSLFTDSFYLVNDGTWYQDFSGNSGYYSRLNTTLTIDNEKSLTTFQAGDIFTRTVADENSVRLGGFKYTKNFGMDRNLITYPTMNIAGTASVPNTVDVFVNNSKVANANVDSGPFVVSNIPFINGDGTAQVVTTDASGRKVTSTLSFYNSSQLLKAGLSDYDYNVGVLRYSRYRHEDNYQHAAGSFSYRYGFTDFLTSALHAEVADKLQVAGTAQDVKLGRLGVVSGSVYHSNTNKEAGNRYRVGYSYNNRTFSLNLSHQQGDSHYHSLADYGSDYAMANKSDQISVSNSLGPVSLGVGYFRTESENALSRIINLSTSFMVNHAGSFYLSFSRDIDGGGNTAYLNWNYFFDTLYSVDFYNQYNRQGLDQTLAISKSITGETGVGGAIGIDHQYRRSNDDWGDSGSSSDFTGSLDWKHRYGELSGGLYQSAPGQQDYWLRSKGALVLMDYNLFATRAVDDAFLLIDTNGVGDVAYSVGGTSQDRTNKRGIAFVPDITSYSNNTVVIHPENIPANVDISQMEQTINVKRGGGRIVRLALQASNNATLHVHYAAGKLLGPGLIVRGLAGGESTFTGYDGVIYLANLDQKRTLEITSPDGVCHITVDPAQINPLSRQVPDLTCK